MQGMVWILLFQPPCHGQGFTAHRGSCAAPPQTGPCPRLGAKAWAASHCHGQWVPTMNSCWCGADFSSSSRSPGVTAGVKEASLCSRIISANPSWLVVLKSLWGFCLWGEQCESPSVKDASNTIALHNCSEGVLGKAADLGFWALSRDISDLYHHCTWGSSPKCTVTKLNILGR